MQHPAIIVVTFALTSMLVLTLILKLFKAEFTLLDVALASISAALTMLVPTIGDYLSIVVMAAVLDYRTSAPLLPDILIATAIARLATIPVGLVVYHALHVI